MGPIAGLNAVEYVLSKESEISLSCLILFDLMHMPRKPFCLIFNDCLDNFKTKMGDSVEEIRTLDVFPLVRRDVATLRVTDDANSSSGVGRYIVSAYPPTPPPTYSSLANACVVAGGNSV